MERLKGFPLARTVKIMRAAGKSAKEIAIACGYGREEEGRNPHFTAFYEELLIVRDKERRVENIIFRDNKRYDNCIHFLLAAIAYRLKYEYRNDWADRCDYSGQKYKDNDSYIVRYYGEKIALFTKEGVQFFMPTKKSPSVKRRINAIMGKFVGTNLYQKKGKWFAVFPLLGDVEYKDGMIIDYPHFW